MNLYPTTIRRNTARSLLRDADLLKRQQKSTRVVITGVGAVTALGLSAPVTWQGLLEGRSGIVRDDVYERHGLAAKIVGRVQGFDPTHYMSHKEARRMAHASQLAIAATQEALTDAKLLTAIAPAHDRKALLELSRVGVVMGTCLGGFSEITRAARVAIKQGHECISPTFITMMLHNAPSANVSRLFGLRGYNSTVSTACASGAQAIGEAAEVIRWGKADVMVAGGTDSPIDDVAAAGFISIHAVTTKFNDCPSRASRPFDRHRSGMVGSEGAGCLILERLEHALARNAFIYAEVLGFGCTADADSMTSPHTDGAGSVAAMQAALMQAQLQPRDVDYISAHATSTPRGDMAETLAIKHAFGERAYRIPISAAKSMIGHTIGASSAIEAVISVLSIRDNRIHPTINYETPDPVCDLDYVPNVARGHKVDVVLSNAFGMGGQNAVLVFGRHN